jgi:hypothetical protein
MRSRYAKFNRTRKETGYRSGLEVQIAASLQGIEALYEAIKIPYTVTSHHTYHPDFVLPKQAIIIEGKGEFSAADRKKMLTVKMQHPDLDIRIVFSNPNAKIGKKSKTTYAGWCKKNGFPYAKGTVPEEWRKHRPKAAQKKALSVFLQESHG